MMMGASRSSAVGGHLQQQKGSLIHSSPPLFSSSVHQISSVHVYISHSFTLEPPSCFQPCRAFMSSVCAPRTRLGSALLPCRTPGRRCIFRGSQGALEQADLWDEGVGECHQGCWPSLVVFFFFFNEKRG